MLFRFVHGRTAIAISALIVGALVSAGCTASTPSPSDTTPIASPTQSAASPKDVPVDARATIYVDPVDYNGVGLVVASFGTPVPDRPVLLQRKFDAGWTDVTKGTLDAAGGITFKTKGVSEGIYRAVALEATVEGAVEPAVSTPEASAEGQWKTELSTEFSGKSLEAGLWDYRATGRYDAGGRQCAAPDPSNVAISGGVARLAVTEEMSPISIRSAKAAGCKKSEVLRNAMISTQNQFTIKTGMMAARVKFPKGQGMHGSVWLQSDDQSEIDMIESYGYGAGLTSVIHVDGQRYPSAGAETYVLEDTVKDKSWWSEYHVYSVEWDREVVIFRVDGVETKRIVQKKPDTEYFLVISNLSSDWEQKRFTEPLQRADNVEPTELPQTMRIDWVRVWSRA